MTPSATVLAMIPAELIFVGGLVLLLFGGTQIPKLARSLGQAQKEFKEGQNDEDKPKGDKGAKNDEGENGK